MQPNGSMTLTINTDKLYTRWFYKEPQEYGIQWNSSTLRYGDTVYIFGYHTDLFDEDMVWVYSYGGISCLLKKSDILIDNGKIN